MPSPYALVLRRQLVEALEEKLLPTGRSAQGLRMLLAELPMRLPPEIKVRHLPIPLLKDTAPVDVGPFVHKWPEAHVNSMVCPYLAFVVEGEADFRIGTTGAMAGKLTPKARENQWARRGCHVLAVPAPSLLFLPPGVPYSDGSLMHWERPHPERAYSRILWCHVWHTGMECHLCATQDNQHSGGHPIVVRDESLVELTALLHQELRLRELHHSAVAQSLLLALLLRLHRRLAVDDPRIANYSSFVALDETVPLPPILVKVDEYILTHLHEPIQVGSLARYCGMSTTHLNRIFRASLGTSVKKYVDQQKMGSARQMLVDDEMAIKEVSRQLGFAQVAHFCRMFNRYARMSPGQYRSLARANSLPGPSTGLNRGLG